MRLTDEHLEGCMRIAATEIEPDIETLIKLKQCRHHHHQWRYSPESGLGLP
jgi:hypothetical protein